ncbi:RHS repeat protein, partial [Escherichia coli]|nr:RHS repeat protein [Escherichia coli]
MRGAGFRNLALVEWLTYGSGYLAG